jgi:hypothetical protein
MKHYKYQEILAALAKEGLTNDKPFNILQFSKDYIEWVDFTGDVFPTFEGNHWRVKPSLEIATAKPLDAEFELV